MNFGRVWKNRHIPFHVPSQVGRVIRSSANFGGGGYHSETAALFPTLIAKNPGAAIRNFSVARHSVCLTNVLQFGEA